MFNSLFGGKAITVVDKATNGAEVNKVDIFFFMLYQTANKLVE
jgi:hypothetical protein